MNRNTQSHFSNVPQIDVRRSRFERVSTHKTTFNAGQLIPIYVDEVLAGDTHSVDMSMVVRMTTPIKPIMDNIYMDTYFFFVPMRLLWSDFKEFLGQNDSTPWDDTTELEVPYLNAPENGWSVGTVADYMGVPTGVALDADSCPSALPFRAYALIWNEWFRDQNLQYPAEVPLDGTIRTGSNDGFDGASSNPGLAALGGLPLPVAKYHDYFTSCLPSPQKGEPVQIPLTGSAPVVLDPDSVASRKGYFLGIYNNGLIASNGFSLMGKDGSTTRPIQIDIGSDGYINDSNNVQGAGELSSGSGSGAEVRVGVTYSGTSPGTHIYPFFSGTDARVPDLRANLENVSYVTINELRTAFAIQRLLERDARSGTRYREVLRAHFGVTVPDSRAMIPEYLGGKRMPINIQQVLQTSETTSSGTPQGNTAAYSHTSDRDSVFTYSSTEPGYIIGVAAIRYDHSYQQGIERFWTRRRRFDFYYPALANIGETPVYRREIYATSSKGDNATVFGYQEAWADYRYKPDRISGEFRSTYDKSLDVWHLGDEYDAAPTLSAGWVAETPSNIDRTLTVPSTTASQFLCDFAFKDIAVRPMPIYSVPGLIDHN